MENRNYILDTDIGPDCDDAAALALAVLYARRHGRRLLAVTHGTSSPWGVGAIRRILKWYGAEAEVGTLKDEGFLSAPQTERYNRVLAQEVSPEEREAEDAAALLRRVLAAQEDGSVEMVGIGPMRNLAHLLASGADGASPLTGRELIARKAARLTVMAGNFTPGCDAPEWNVEMDVESARLVAAQWPGEVVWCGWEVGERVIALREPCALCTVQWAMDGENANYAPSPAGTVDVDERGVTRWTAREGGRHRYLSLAVSPEQAARSMEAVLAEYDHETGAKQ